jgi:hypothetical protein
MHTPFHMARLPYLYQFQYNTMLEDLQTPSWLDDTLDIGLPWPIATAIVAYNRIAQATYKIPNQFLITKRKCILSVFIGYVLDNTLSPIPLHSTLKKVAIMTRSSPCLQECSYEGNHCCMQDNYAFADTTLTKMYDT